MSVIAKQSTARDFIVGPVLDSTGAAVTNLTVGALKISKNGGAPAALNGSATLTHRNTGHYSLALTASDLDTVGQAEVVIDKTTDAMPTKVITVIEEAVYDALYAASATGKLPANVTEWLGTAVAAATAGNPNVNVTRWNNALVLTSTGLPSVSMDAILGGAQSATDLKDFADDGYDPATNKVQGVVLVDTLTTYTSNTPQTGDSFARLGAPAGASVSADVAAVKTDTGNLVTRITSTLFSGITSLAQWLGLIAGKQTGNSTARTELRATGAGSGTFDETTDSQEAIRDNQSSGGGDATLANQTTIINGITELKKIGVNQKD